MNLSDITERVNRLGSAWEEYKSLNDRRLTEIETKGQADPLTTQQLNKLSDALDQYKHRVDRVETAISRPGLESKAQKAEGPYAVEYRDAFCQYLRKGQDAALEAFQGKSLSVGSDPDGGYLVTPTLSQNIVQTVYETSPVRQLASVEVISSDALELLDDKDEAAAGWTSETASVTDTATPQHRNWAKKAYRCMNSMRSRKRPKSWWMMRRLMSKHGWQRKFPTFLSVRKILLLLMVPALASRVGF